MLEIYFVEEKGTLTTTRKTQNFIFVKGTFFLKNPPFALINSAKQIFWGLIRFN